MIVLALDACTDRLSVAAQRDAGPVASRFVDGSRRHAASIVPAVIDALAEIGADIGDVEAVAVSDGPGSFTGLRVSVAFAKSIARAKNIPLWTASTLLVRAWSAWRASGQGMPAVVAGIGSALRGDVYVAAYRVSASGNASRAGDRNAEVPNVLVEPLLEPTVVPGSSLSPLPVGVRVLAGDGAAASPWAPGAVLVDAPNGWPTAGALIELMRVPGGAERVADPAGWEPSYGRPAEAQARWEAMHGRPLVDPARTA